MLNSIDALRSRMIVNYSRCICFGLYFISPINNNNNDNNINKKNIKILNGWLRNGFEKDTGNFLELYCCIMSILYLF